MENKEARLIKIKEEIYITTDEEIKEGDWAYNIVQRTYFMVSKSFMKIIGNTLPTNKKIIATTNTKLNLGICEDCKQDKDYRHNFIKCTCSLPQPSRSFIEVFCEADGIENVLVEYDCISSVSIDVWDFKPEGITIDKGKKSECIEYKLKVNSHNEITIHPIKSSWTREEVITFGLKCIQAAKDVDNQDDSGIITIDEYWIKENL